MTTEPTETAAPVDVSALLPIRVEHTLITGHAGSGRDQAMVTLQEMEHADPTINSWVCDPARRQRPATAARHERYAAGTQAAIELLTEARSVVEIRGIVTHDRESYRFQPTQDAPLVVLSLHDADVLLEDQQVLTTVLEIAKRGRSVGVVLRVAITSIDAVRCGESLAKRLTERPPLVLPRRRA